MRGFADSYQRWCLRLVCFSNALCLCLTTASGKRARHSCSPLQKTCVSTDFLLSLMCKNIFRQYMKTFSCILICQICFWSCSQDAGVLNKCGACFPSSPTLCFFSQVCGSGFYGVWHCASRSSHTAASASILGLCLTVNPLVLEWTAQFSFCNNSFRVKTFLQTKIPLKFALWKVRFSQLPFAHPWLLFNDT